MSECLLLYVLLICIVFLFVLFAHFTNEIFGFLVICTVCIFRILPDVRFPRFMVCVFALFKMFSLVQNVTVLYDHRTSL